MSPDAPVEYWFKGIHYRCGGAIEIHVPEEYRLDYRCAKCCQMAKKIKERSNGQVSFKHPKKCAGPFYGKTVAEIMFEQV